MNEDFSKITLRELSIFQEICRSRSLRSVARTHHTTAGNVSKLLKGLERKTGVVLVKRSPKGVIPTPDGQRLCENIEPILRHANNLEPGEIHEEAQPLLSIGAVRFLITDLVTPCSKEFSEALESYRFRLLDLAPDDLVAAGIKGAFEICVHLEPLEWTKSWYSEQLGNLNWSLVVRKDHPLSEHSSSKEVCNYPFVVPNYWEDGNFVVGSDYCPVPWKERKKGYEISSASAAIELVKSTDQVAFVPDILAQRGIEEGSIRRVIVDDWPRQSKPVYLSVREDIVSKRVMKQLAESFKARLGG